MLILVDDYSYIDPAIRDIYFHWFDVESWGELKQAFEKNFNYKIDAA